MRFSSASLYSCFVGVSLACFWSTPVNGQSPESSTAESVPATAPTTVESNHVDSGIQVWVEMLESPRYRDRATATANLKNLGASAIATLKGVATEGGSEASDRAIEILKRHYNSDDEVLKAKAGEALEQIVEEQENPKSKVAEKILNPAEPTPNRQALPQFRLRPAVNRAINIRVTTKNGDKDITVEENGKSIRIQEDKAGGIRVERKDANGKITKQAYPDVDKLKAGDPEAHRAYQRANPNGGRFQIERNGRGLPKLPGAPPLPPGLDEIRKRHEAIRQEHLKRFEKMRAEHLRRMEHLKSIPNLPRRAPLPPRQRLPSREIKTADPIEV